MNGSGLKSATVALVGLLSLLVARPSHVGNDKPLPLLTEYFISTIRLSRLTRALQI